jgi:hypothetical protein
LILQMKWRIFSSMLLGLLDWDLRGYDRSHFLSARRG